MIIKSKELGFTLIEVMIAVAILGIISLGLYSMLSSANRSRSIANAKGVAKDEVEVALRQLGRDVTMARAPTNAEKTSGKTSAIVKSSNSVQFNIAEERSGQIVTKPVKYDWDISGKKLERTYDGNTRPLMTHLSTFEIDYDPSATTSGTVMIKVEATVLPDGYQNAPQIHSQETIVTVHEEAVKEKAGAWKKTGDILDSFSGS